MERLVITVWKTNATSFPKKGGVGGKSEAHSKHFLMRDIIFLLFALSFSFSSSCSLVLSPISFLMTVHLLILHHLSFTNLGNLMLQTETLDWPYCFPKAHGLKPRPVFFLLSLPNPLAFLSSDVCELSLVLLGCPSLLCVQTCQSHLHGSVIRPVRVSKQQGSQPPEAVRRHVSMAVGGQKPHVGRTGWKQSSGLDDTVVWPAKLFLHSSDRHQLSPVGSGKHFHDSLGLQTCICSITSLVSDYLSTGP